MTLTYALFLIACGAFASWVLTYTYMVDAVIEANRQRDNAITSRDVYRNILDNRDDAAPAPAPPKLPANRIAFFFKE